MRIRLATPLVVAVLLLLTACGTPSKPQPAPAPAAPAPATAPQRGDLTIGFIDLQTNLDPMKSVAPPATVLYPAFADTLNRLNTETLKLEPALATSWKRVDDLTMEVKLRPGVKFSNGEPFNADAVKFSFERAMNAGLTLSVTGRIKSIKAVQVIDDTTVRIITSAPDPLLDWRLSLVYMVPPKYLTQVGEKEWPLKPVGTGPFKLAKVTPQQEVVFEAWDESWRGAPQVKKLTFKVIPDAAARTASLLSGGVDMIYALSPDDVKKVQAAGFDVINKVHGLIYIVNLKSIGTSGPFTDVKVRQAVNYAIDKESIVRDLFLGMNEATPGQPLFPFLNGYNPNVKAYPYDPKKARELLAEAGYPNGFKTIYAVSSGRTVLDKQVGEAIVGYLAQVGIQAEMQVVDAQGYLTQFADPTKRPDMRQSTWGLEPLLDVDIIMPWYLCSESRKLLCDPKYDALYQASVKEMDPARRQKILQDAMQVLHDDAPEISLFGIPDIFGVSKKVQGFKPRVDGMIAFDALSIKS